MKRIFIGIPVSQSVTAGIKKSLQSLSQFEDRFFWIPEENWHITLQYIGEVEDEKVPEIQKAFSAFVSKQKYFNIYFDAIDFFPNERNARKIVLKMVKNRNLMELQFGLRKALGAFLTTEANQKFFPHASIINLKRGAVSPEMKEKVAGYEFKKRLEVDTLACMESFIDGPPPVRYEVLSEVKMIVDDKFKTEDPEDA